MAIKYLWLKYFWLHGLLLIALLFGQSAFAFDSLNLLTHKVVLDDAGYVSTVEALSPEVAIQQSFEAIPKQAMSIGLDKSYRWFRFQLSQHDASEPRYLEYQNKTASLVELYVFNDNKIVRHEIQGYKSGQNNNKNIRFLLEKSTEPVVYLVKVESVLSDFIVFNIGSSDALNQQTDWINTFTMITATAISILMIYNLFLFFSVREVTYFYYVLYIGALLLIDLNVRGLIPLYDLSGEVIDIYVTSLFMVQLEQIGLVFFTINFLDLDKKDPALKKYLLIVFYIDILLTPTLIFGLEVFMLIAIQIMGIMLLYAGIRSMLSGNKAALYYTLATGVAVVLLSLWLMSMLNLFVPVTVWSNSLCHIALIWDGLMLSFALAYRIRYLQQEKLASERLLMLKSRQNHIGELSGNIAHQWRQPLAELGAIMANLEAKLKYAEQAPTKDEIIKDVKQSTQILKHLSNTITTFQSFFQNNKTTMLFSVNEALTKTVNFVKDSLNDNKIVIDLNTQYDFFIEGDANALSQAILSIIMNAKEVLLTREVTNPYISMVLRKQDDMIIIDITDNAGGIAITPIESVFDSYITDKDHGIGIGLFITKSIIENGFNGQVTAKNNKQGAVFSITIPVA